MRLQEHGKLSSALRSEKPQPPQFCFANSPFGSSEDEHRFLKATQNSIYAMIASCASDLLLTMATEQFSTSGKKIRPRLVYGLSKALGLNPANSVGWAAACEVLHNATLVHDDLQDGDEWRRGVETVWKKHGSAQAINLGDFLIASAPLLILNQDLPPRATVGLASLYAKMAAQIVNGQSFEAILNELKRDGALELAYFRCASQKTSALFGGIVQGVALIGGLEAQRQEHIRLLFHELGTIFQIQDDILDLFGDKKRKSVGCDIQEGKVSFLVVTHLTRHPNDWAFVQEVLQRPRELTDQGDIRAMTQLFEEKGTLSAALDKMTERLAQIRFSPAFHSSPDLFDFVRGFIAQILLPIRHLREMTW